MNLKIENKTTAEVLNALNKSVHSWHVKKYPKIFKDDSDNGLLQYFKSSLENPDYFHFIAFDGDKPIGFIQAEIKSYNGSP